MSAEERIDQTLERLRAAFLRHPLAGLDDHPLLPPIGGTEEEVAGIESRSAVALPLEYKAFLRRCRYIDFGGGVGISGLDWAGEHPAGSPWICEEHEYRGSWWVIGDAGDGSQYLMPTAGATSPVLFYLHDGPALEEVAPSFSLFLWRLAQEAWMGLEVPSPREPRLSGKRERRASAFTVRRNAGPAPWRGRTRTEMGES